jgi:FkbM family methyltransferase
MSFRLSVRRMLASQFRNLPRFRGEGRLASFLQNRLTDYNVPEECLSIVEMRNGTRIQIDLRSNMHRHIFWRSAADDATLRVLASLLPVDAHMLDLGANVGVFTLPLARRLRANGGKVYAFEPMLPNFQQLCFNVGLNELESVVESYNLAMGNEIGIAHISMDDAPNAESGNAYITDGVNSSEWKCGTMPVPITTLDAWSAERQLPRCDFIKIDVEGCEYSVFQAAGRFLREYRPIIFCELNHRRMRKCHWSAEDLQTLLRPSGYGMFHYQHGQMQRGCVGGMTTEDVYLLPEERRADIAATLSGPLPKLHELLAPVANTPRQLAMAV